MHTHVHTHMNVHAYTGKCVNTIHMEMEKEKKSLQEITWGIFIS